MSLCQNTFENVDRVAAEHALDIIPSPRYVHLTSDTLTLDTNCSVQIVNRTNDSKLDCGLNMLVNDLNGFANVSCDNKHINTTRQIQIVIEILNEDCLAKQEEGYQLQIHTDGISIRACDVAGCFYGIQSLRQLLRLADRNGTQLLLPCALIEDQPAYAWRGMMVDSARNFQPVTFLKTLIDHLSLYKFNVIHWHLVDDQAWRLEIQSHPLLTQTASNCSMGDHSRGGFYSQQQVRELVAYAADRFIQIIPEIEMPGHCQSVLTVYPHLSCTGGPFDLPTVQCITDDIYCAGNDAVFSFLKDVLNEVVDLFPAPFVHIGGDEAPKDRWEKCPCCRLRMAEAGLEDEADLQGWFIARIHAHLKPLGRRLIAWDDMANRGLPSDVVFQWWRNRTPDAWRWPSQWAARGHASVFSPTSHCYLDYSEEKISVAKTLTLDLLPDTQLITQQRADELFMGGECNVWTEKIPWEKFFDHAFPRAYAFIEALWRADAQSDADQLIRRIRRHPCPDLSVEVVE